MSWTAQEATKQLTSYAMENFTLPGEPGFPLNSVYAAPASRVDGGTLSPPFFAVIVKAKRGARC